MLIGAGRLGQPAGLVIDVIMALAGTIDAIGPVQAGIEPLRAVGGTFLRRQHVGKFVAKGACIGFGIEIAAFPAPIGPGTRQTVEHLLGGAFTGGLLGAVLLGLLAPQKFRYAFFRYRL